MKLKFNTSCHFWVHTSSTFESLFDAFTKLIFSDRDPFADRIVVVPSPLMQSYLSFEMAKRFPVAMQVTFASSRQAIFEIQKKLKKNRGRFVPDRLEMAAAIWEELPSSYQGEKREELAEKLSELFLSYGLREIPFREEAGWQEALYSRLYKKYPRWTTPYLEIQEMISEGAPELPRFTSLFLFAHNYLPPLDRQFYEWISGSSPVHEFALLPSSHYLTDQLSDGAVRRQGGDYEERQPLVANLGRLAKERQRTIAERPVIEIPHFPVKEVHSLLTALQRDISTLSKPRRGVIENRRSIELHHAETPLREVEILYDLLAKVLDQGIAPEEIIVMAPDSSLYAPLIRAYFHDFPAKMELLDLSCQLDNQAVEAFSILLTLLEGRFDRSSFEKLIDHPLSKAHEAAPEIKRWLKRFPLGFGKDPEMRKVWLREEGLDSQGAGEGTLKWALEKLMHEMAVGGEHLSPSPTELPELAAWIELLHALDKGEELKEKELSARMWQSALKELWSSIFSASEELFLPLLLFFEKLGSIERSLEDRPLPWSFVRREFSLFAKGRLLKSTAKDPSAIRFSSLLPMRAIPARCIIVMGMSSDAFPKKEELSPLDLSDPEIFMPRRQDFDRALFLETLLSAREHLFFLYNKDEERTASSLIEELLNYIREQYEVEGELEFFHPATGYDRRNFYSPFDSYSSFYHRIAFPQFEKEEKVFTKREDADANEVSPYLFSLAAKDPISLYLKESLRLEMKEEEEEPYQLLVDPKREKTLLMQLFAKERGEFPMGLFGKREEERLKTRAGALLEKLNPEALFQVELHPRVKGVKRIGDQIFAVEAPRIHIEGREVAVVGLLNDLSFEGLLLNIDNKRERVVGEWGKLLLWNWVAKKMEIEPTLWMLKEEEMEKRSGEIDPLPDALSRYGNFFAHAKRELLLLDPKRIITLKESIEDMKKEEPPFKEWNLYHRLLSRRENCMSEEELRRAQKSIQEGFLWDHPLLTSIS